MILSKDRTNKDTVVNTGHNRKNVNWSKIIQGPLIEDINTYQQRFGKNPTLRGCYYRLLAKGYFENTRTTYHNFIDATSIARWKFVVHNEKNGKINFDLMPEGYFTPHHIAQLNQIMYKKGPRLPFDCFADDTRITRIDFPDNYVSPYTYNDRAIQHLRNAPANYVKNCIPRWLYQPNLVEIWTEKYTMLDTLNNILLDKRIETKTINGKEIKIEVSNDRQVRVVPDRGFASNGVFQKANQRFTNFMYRTFYSNKLKDFTYYDYSGEKKIYIFYVGDYDPSGDNMDMDIVARLARFGWGTNRKTGKGNLIFQRIAITKDLINQYSLPYDPDSLTKAKLVGTIEKKGDSRTVKFIDKNNGVLYAVEVDAFPAIYYDEFANLVLKQVDAKDVFDIDIYNNHVLPEINAGPKKVAQDRDERIKFLEKSDITGNSEDEED